MAAPLPVLFAGQSGPFAAAALRALLRAAAASRGPNAPHGAFRVVAVLEGAGAKAGPHRRTRWGWGRMLGRPASPTHSLDLQAIAEALALPYAFEADAQRASAALRLARRSGAAVAACAGFPTLWGPQLLDAFAACFNVHPSLLPRWRGPAPLFWWLRSGEPETGVTVHGMVARADAGPAYARVPLTPPWQADAAALWGLCGELGGRALGALLARPRASWVALSSAGPESWAPRPSLRDATVAPAAWAGAALLRYAQGAPGLARPRVVVDGAPYDLLGGVAFRPGEALPGHYVRQGDVLWVRARDGVVGLRANQASP